MKPGGSIELVSVSPVLRSKAGLPRTMRWQLVCMVGSTLVEGCTALLRLATWNILAPQYTRADKYPWCAPSHLEWDYRQSLIVPQLLEWDADVVCLQEVQVDLWPGLLGALGDVYEGVIQNVTNGHNVASALLLKRQCPWNIERVESRSRALLTVLRDDKTTKERLVVASIHLEAGIKNDNDLQRYHQIKSLFKRIEHHCELDSIPLQDAAIVLAGDFNMLRSDLMHYCLSKGQLYHPEELKNKPPIPIVSLQDALKTEPSVQMTFAKGYVLDYIWTTKEIQIAEALQLSPFATKCIPRLWPCEDHPSDHLPIGVELSF